MFIHAWIQNFNLKSPCWRRSWRTRNACETNSKIPEDLFIHMTPATLLLDKWVSCIVVLLLTIGFIACKHGQHLAQNEYCEGNESHGIARVFYTNDHGAQISGWYDNNYNIIKVTRTYLRNKSNSSIHFEIRIAH